MYGAVPGRTQSRPAIRVRPPFRQIWSRGFDGLLEFPAVVFEGVAYVGNAHGEIFAVAMENGALVWKHPQRGGKMASSPAVWGDRVVVHGMDGFVRVLDRRNGRLLWSKRIGSPIESSPVVGGGVDYFGDRSGRVYALDLRTRAFRWVRSFGAKITSSAALSGGRVYIGDYAGRVLALAQADGSTVWSRSCQRPRLRDAGGGRRARLRALVDRALADRVHDLGALPLAPLHRRLRLLLACRLARPGLRRLLRRPPLLRSPPASGRTLWALSAGGPISGAVTVAGGVVYAGSTRGTHRRRERPQRPRPAPLPARRVRGRLRQRRHAAPARVLPPVRDEGRAMRKWILIAAGALLLGRRRPRHGLRRRQAAAVGGRARLLDRRVRPERARAGARARRARRALADLPLRPRPPRRRPGHQPAAAVPPRLDLPRPLARRVPAGDRPRPALPRHQPRRRLRDQRQDREARLGRAHRPLPGRLARDRAEARLRQLPQQASVQPGRGEGPARRARRLLRRLGRRPLDQEDRPQRVLAGGGRGLRLRRRLERPRLELRRRERPAALGDRR